MVRRQDPRRYTQFSIEVVGHLPAAEPLADTSGTVVEVWPRFRSGDYLVTLEYAQPVRLGKELIYHIDAFVSELRCGPPGPGVNGGAP